MNNESKRYEGQAPPLSPSGSVGFWLTLLSCQWKTCAIIPEFYNKNVKTERGERGGGIQNIINKLSHGGKTILGKHSH